MDFNHKEDFYSDAYIADILNTTKRIALVGASDKPERASYRVFKFLLDKGYDVIPVSPKFADKDLLGQKGYASLDQVPGDIDLVDVFRNSRDAGGVVDEAIKKGAKVAWLQLEIINHEAADRAEAAGLKMVMNRCPAIEYPRLGLS
ncbi:CoA-binding protein [Curvivirga sp.]|uniref:CoA-binding protein n=1 Tax=Curvivirga sp. TaxID=2856848 RepID=UPI003B5A2151